MVKCMHVFCGLCLLDLSEHLDCCPLCGDPINNSSEWKRAVQIEELIKAYLYSSQNKEEVVANPNLSKEFWMENCITTSNPNLNIGLCIFTVGWRLTAALLTALNKKCNGLLMMYCKTTFWGRMKCGKYLQVRMVDEDFNPHYFDLHILSKVRCPKHVVLLTPSDKVDTILQFEELRINDTVILKLHRVLQSDMRPGIEISSVIRNEDEDEDQVVDASNPTRAKQSPVFWDVISRGLLGCSRRNGSQVSRIVVGKKCSWKAVEDMAAELILFFSNC